MSSRTVGWRSGAASDERKGYGVRYWLLKTEPARYAYEHLEDDGATVWDGVSNAAALRYVREVQPGDQALIYHTGAARCVVGIAEVTSAAYPDPHRPVTRALVFDVRPLRRLPRPVTLAALKADAHFAEHPLVRQARLSVVPLSPDDWEHIVHLSAAAL
jgi:predicted RNA-binding protein with PUA-like domain